MSCGGAAMLPLTPPNEPSEPFDPSPEDIDRENGIALTGSEQYPSQQHASAATPISNSSMGLDSLEEGSDIADRPDFQDFSDEDQEMAEYGAYPPFGTALIPSTTELSLVGEPYPQMDIPQTEVMALPTGYSEFTMENHYYSDPFQDDNLSQLAGDSNDTMEDEMGAGLPLPVLEGASVFPVGISELSEQLQHIQDEHDPPDFISISDAQNGLIENMEDQFNLHLDDFLHAWGRTMLREDEPKRRRRGPALPAVSRQRDLKDLAPMEPHELQGEKCDIQRIDWSELGISRLEARDMRQHTYRNFTHLRASNRPIRNAGIPRLTNHNDYFRFRRMDFDHDVHLSHFQLRNLVACYSRDHIYYAGRSKVLHYSSKGGSERSDQYSTAMDLTQPSVQPFHGIPGGAVQISTLTVAHDILVAGGFCGEYGITNLRAHKDTRHTEGIITDDSNAITNHVQVHLSRGSSLPIAAFASNDNGVRLLDVNTNRIITHHRYENPINCTAISPDQRLRVLTGDTRKVMICNAETGEILQELEGHRDYGFACDWADDGWTVATGNQDMQVMIWDARKWKSQGVSCPVATIAAEMAGVRKLKFSPVGSGKRVLIAAEPADFVSVIDAATFSSKQDLTFFGEIGGVDFTNDGQDLIVANCDNMRGGIMEYERCDFGGDSFFESNDEGTRRNGLLVYRGYDWMDDDDESSRGWKRKAAMLEMPMLAF